MLGNFACFVVCQCFSKWTHFQKLISENLSVCQIAWNQLRPDVLSGLNWVQTVCKSYQQTTKSVTSRQTVKEEHIRQDNEKFHLRDERSLEQTIHWDENIQYKNWAMYNALVSIWKCIVLQDGWTGIKESVIWQDWRLITVEKWAVHEGETWVKWHTVDHSYIQRAAHCLTSKVPYNTL